MGKNILWISGRLPFPLFSGDAIYTASILRVLAAGNFEIVLLGIHRSSDPANRQTGESDQFRLVCVSPSRRFEIASILSPLPKDAFVLATHEMRSALCSLLNDDRWDWIVIDHANSGGILPEVLRNRRNAKICYISHNVEAVIRSEIANAWPNGVRRLMMLQDAVKYTRLENRLVASADLVTAITPADAAVFSRLHPNVHVIPPSYLGDRVDEGAVIKPSSERAIMLVGSFGWRAKQRNLEQIVGSLYPALEAVGITLKIVGMVPPPLIAELVARCPKVNFCGKVTDFRTIATSCRGGLVAEDLGGGFKLKILDYAFMRLPIFGLSHGVTGMTTDEKSAMFLADDMQGLSRAIVANIDNIEELNRRSGNLYSLASDHFSKMRVQEAVSTAFEPDDISI